MIIAIDVQPLLESRPGGVRTYTIELARELRRSYPYDTIVAYSQGRHGPQSAIMKSWATDSLLAAIQWYHRPLPNSVALALSFISPSFICMNRWLMRKLSGKPVDVVIVPNLFSSSYCHCHPFTHPFIVTAHDCSFVRNPSWYSLKSRCWHWRNRIPRLLDRASAIVAVSNETKKDICDCFGVNPQRVEVVEPFINPHYTQARGNAREQKDPVALSIPRLLTIGVVEKRKNLQGIIQALETLPSSVVFRWDIVGPLGFGAGQVQSLLTGRLENRQHAIVYHGTVDDNQKVSLIQQCDALVYPSFYEGYGYPLKELSETHSPWVITSAATSLPHAAQYHKTLLVNPFDPSEIRDALMVIAASQRRGWDLSSFSHDAVGNDDESQNSQRYHRLLEAVVAKQ